MGPETLGGEPRSLSEPHEACRRKTVQWSRPAVEEVCGGRNRAFVPRVGAGAPVAVHEAERLGCTYARNVQSRRALVRRAFSRRA